MTEEKKITIDQSEFKDWQENKVTTILQKLYAQDLETFKMMLLTMNEDLSSSEKKYWKMRGVVASVEALLAFMNDYTHLESILQTDLGDAEDAKAS